MAELIVVGSYNAGLTIYNARLPAPGETVLGYDFHIGPGGKGANQAIGAARLGADVLFVAEVGDDEFGVRAQEVLRQEGLPTRGVRIGPGPTGVAMILVDVTGTNMIAVAPGVNADLRAESVIDELGDEFGDCRLLLLQLECSADLAIELASWARRQGISVLLNPAPARTLSIADLSLFDVVTPNESELALLTEGLGLSGKAPGDLAGQLVGLGVPNVVVTLGQEGAIWASEQGLRSFRPPAVKPVDTTGCGDAFTAGLAAGLVRGLSFPEAVELGCRAGAYCATRRAVIDGLATSQELDSYFEARLLEIPSRPQLLEDELVVGQESGSDG